MKGIKVPKTSHFCSKVFNLFTEWSIIQNIIGNDNEWNTYNLYEVLYIKHKQQSLFLQNNVVRCWIYTILTF
jgi:hypothetical protein